jgi:uncharacterized membrane-anchored protein
MTAGLTLPGNHPDRMALNNEVHARPPEALNERMRISYLVLFGELDMAPLRELCGKYGVEVPGPSANHFSADLGPFRLKWERHTEFTRYWFLVPATGVNQLFEKTALQAVPDGWLKSLKGEVLVANHVELMPAPRGKPDEEKLSQKYFAGNPLVGSAVSGGAGRAFTDFRIHADGFGRMLVQHSAMTPRQRGRTVQRLLEVDTYRVLALLTLPVARKLMPGLSRFEGELGEITSAMREAGEADEPKLLDRLTLLHADVVREHTATQFRFSAARAYADLVALRISELREERIEGLQPFAEFTDRRLAPAMRTCEAVAKRLDTVSERVSRATQMLSTRVAISREKQNQELLESMDRRAKLQLRLQETVEGLSIAAITYYIVGLIGYLAKGAKEAGLLPASDLIVTAISIPIVIAFVAWGVRRVRKSITG